MIRSTRLETILKMLLHQKTGRLEPPATTFNDRVENLAHHLSREGVIILVGDLHPTQRPQRNIHLGLWMNTYAELYYLLNFGLFDASDEPIAYLADNDYPLVVVFEARTYIVVQVMTDLIIPYIALRQSDGRASRAELRGMMDSILEELEAMDLPPTRLQTIRSKGVQYLENLLTMDIKQVSLTNFSQAFLIQSGMARAQSRNIPRPDSLPELPEQRPKQQVKPKPSPETMIPIMAGQNTLSLPPDPPRLTMLDRLNNHPIK